MSVQVRYIFRRSGNALLAEDEDAAELLRGIGNGEAVEVEIKRPRNLAFHRKWFALAKKIFEVWEEVSEPVMHKGHPIQRNFDRFRKDLIIMTGNYDVVVNIKNEPRLEAKSISFAGMSQTDFEDLYSKTIDVALQKILAGTAWTEGRLRECVEDIVRF